jgi:hypothetical protein
MKVDIDEVRDSLIIEFCNVLCPEYKEDYQCPDYTCIVWELLTRCTLKSAGIKHLNQSRDS